MDSSRGDKTICLPFDSEEHYQACVAEPQRFRQVLLELFERHPELFPSHLSEGFTFDDKRYSEKQQMWIRRIELKATKQKLSIRPSLVLPYMTARTEAVEKALFLRHWNVFHDALAHVFGRNPMFWYPARAQALRAHSRGFGMYPRSQHRRVGPR